MITYHLLLQLICMQFNMNGGLWGGGEKETVLCAGTKFESSLFWQITKMYYSLLHYYLKFDISDGLLHQKTNLNIILKR